MALTAGRSKMGEPQSRTDGGAEERKKQDNARCDSDGFKGYGDTFGAAEPRTEGREQNCRLHRPDGGEKCRPSISIYRKAGLPLRGVEQAFVALEPLGGNIAWGLPVENIHNLRSPAFIKAQSQTMIAIIPVPVPLRNASVCRQTMGECGN